MIDQNPNPHPPFHHPRRRNPEVGANIWNSSSSDSKSILSQQFAQCLTEQNQVKMIDQSPNQNPNPPPTLCRHAAAEDGVEMAACTGKSCQSCMAGAIADCVALCCCPCAVVNFFVLTVFKLPWAVARRCLLRRRRRRRRMLEERKCGGGETGKAEGGMLEIVVSTAVGGAAEEYITAEEVWLELAEIGHLGFGRVSSARISFHTKGN